MAIGYYIASVKISKQNVTGDDISSNVSELLRFTLNYSDIDPITFEILSKVEYPTYYQLQVKFQGYGNINTLAASVNNYTRNYTLSAELSPQTSSILLYDNVIGNSLGYYNPSNGKYTLGYTPNTTLYVTASALINSVVGSPNAQLIFAKQLTPSTYQTILSTPPTLITPSSFVNFELSGSFTPINGEIYITYVTSSTTSDLTSSFGNFYINQLESAALGTSGSGNDVVLYLAGDNNENPLYGNAGNIVENPHYSKVDYVEYILPESEFETILSGLGTKSDVKQYNYELLRSVLPRYKGSRFTSDAYNTNSIVTASLIQSSYPIYLNAKSYGYIPINTYDTTIFEFNGGHSTIEVSKTSRVDISSILNVDNISSVSTIYPTDTAFGKIIENKIRLKTEPIVNQYSTNEIIVPSDIKVVSNNVSPIPLFMTTTYPQDWTYISGSQQSNSPLFATTGSFYKIDNYADGDDFRRVGYTYEGTVNTDNCIFYIPTWLSQSFVNLAVTWSNGSKLSKIDENEYGFIIGNNPNQVNIIERSWYVYKDPDGNYSPNGSVTTNVISQSIANGINKGERYFITLFDTPFKAPININNITPLINTFTGSSDEINYPLPYSSAYEIATIGSFGTTIVFNFKPPVTSAAYKIFQGPSGVLFGGGSGRYGLIIWKSPPNSNTILFSGTNLTKLGLGNVITTDTSPTIKENLNYISKTFGSNP